MATRIFSCGFETGLNELNFRPAANNAPTISTVKARTGTYSLLNASNAPASWGRLFAPLTELRAAYSFNHLGISGTDTALDRSSYLFYILKQDGTSWRIGWQHTNSYFFIASAISTNFYSGAAGTGNAGDFFTQNVWHDISLAIKIDASAGWINLYINGVEALAYAGNTGSSPVIGVGIMGSASSNGDWAAGAYGDDFYTDSTVGEAAQPAINKRFYYLPANANGSLSQFTGSDGNQIDNYLLVDEVSDHDVDTTFVRATEVGLIDSYGHATLADIDNYIPVAVIPTSYTRRTNATVNSKIQHRLYKGVDDTLGDEKELFTTYSFMQDRFTVLPDGSLISVANINATEIGIAAAGSY